MKCKEIKLIRFYFYLMKNGTLKKNINLKRSITINVVKLILMNCLKMGVFTTLLKLLL